MIGDGHFQDGAVGHEELAVFVEVVPRVVAVFGFSVGGGDVIFGGGATSLAGQADADQAFADSEEDAPTTPICRWINPPNEPFFVSDFCVGAWCIGEHEVES